MLETLLRRDQVMVDQVMVDQVMVDQVMVDQVMVDQVMVDQASCLEDQPQTDSSLINERLSASLTAAVRR
ncbi:hypothetical protein EYF80_065760 [Liparis tanakae]|uniref:Uncharacterized protein n=1 Tax=Liparis tanakae TaxID=230148 RepID=A0A4Z2E5V9_9TELE|nr:hypothetical protein EYF80_065760 [Liparis tanakae]